MTWITTVRSYRNFTVTCFNCVAAVFVTTPNQTHFNCWSPKVVYIHVRLLSGLLSAPLPICVNGGECGETLLRRWKGAVGYKKKNRGKEKGGIYWRVQWGSLHLVAKEWLIRQADTNERFVCPHIGLAVMSLSSFGILQIPPSLSSTASLWQRQI